MIHQFGPRSSMRAAVNAICGATRLGAEPFTTADDVWVRGTSAGYPDPASRAASSSALCASEATIEKASYSIVGSHGACSLSTTLKPIVGLPWNTFLPGLQKAPILLSQRYDYQIGFVIVRTESRIGSVLQSNHGAAPFAPLDPNLLRSGSLSHFPLSSVRFHAAGSSNGHLVTALRSSVQPRPEDRIDSSARTYRPMKLLAAISEAPVWRRNRGDSPDPTASIRLLRWNPFVRPLVCARYLLALAPITDLKGGSKNKQDGTCLHMFGAAFGGGSLLTPYRTVR